MAQQLALPGFDLKAPPVHNLFLAVLPGRAAAGSTRLLARSLHAELGSGGRPQMPACLHLSLLGLRMAAPPRPRLVAALSEAAAGIALAPFDLALDRVMTFRGEPGRLPVVLCGGGGAAALSSLHSTLAAQLERLGLAQRRRSRFTPHLTLLHADRPIPQRAVPAIAWRVGELVLIHGHGRPYRHEVLGRWPLGDDSAQAGAGITSQSSGGRAAKARSVEPRTMPATSSGAVW